MICNVRDGVGSGVGSWFDDNTRRVVGNGRNTFFWTDNWLGGAPLKLQFSRLFELSVHKECSVEDMVSLGWMVGGGAWRWRRRLLAWEEESLRDCSALLVNVVLQDNIQDSWRWLLDPTHGYLVRGVYRYLTSFEETTSVAAYNNVWHKLVPSKVSLFAWRLLKDRIPTRTNLVSRHVLQPSDNLCVGGCGNIESADHLFIGCNLFGSVWYLICLWLGISFVCPGLIVDHFTQFIHMAGLPRSTHGYFKVIWLAATWAIWKDRNNCAFKNKVVDPFQAKLFLMVIFESCSYCF
jgi:hypothetical protein